jgi:hypothetical protein
MKYKSITNKYYPDNILIMSYVFAFVNLIYTEGALQLVNMYWIFIGFYFFITHKYHEVKLSELKKRVKKC